MSKASASADFWIVDCSHFRLWCSNTCNSGRLRTASSMKSNRNRLHTVFTARTVIVELWCQEARPNDASAGRTSTLDKRCLSVIWHSQTSSKVLWIGTQPSALLNFILPVITFSRSIIGLPSIEKNICIIKYFSIRNEIQSIIMLPSIAFLVRPWRLWCSIQLQVGAFFNSNYLITAWELHRSVLVTFPKFDVLLLLIASRWSHQSQIGARNFDSKIKRVRKVPKTWIMHQLNNIKLFLPLSRVLAAAHCSVWLLLRVARDWLWLILKLDEMIYFEEEVLLYLLTVLAFLLRIQYFSIVSIPFRNLSNFLSYFPEVSVNSWHTRSRRLTHVLVWQCRPAWADFMASELIADNCR